MARACRKCVKHNLPCGWVKEETEENIKEEKETDRVTNPGLQVNTVSRRQGNKTDPNLIKVTGGKKIKNQLKFMVFIGKFHTWHNVTTFLMQLNLVKISMLLKNK